MQLFVFIIFRLSFAFIMNRAHNIEKSESYDKNLARRVICQVILACRFKSGHMRVGMASNDVEND